MQTLDQAKAHAGQLRKLADWLTDSRIEELYRRALHEARDGYPASTRGAEAHGRGGHTDPTGFYALGSDPPDVVGRWLTEGFAMLNEAAGIATGIKGRFEESLRAPASDSEKRTGAGDCQACGEYCSGAEIDRLRSFYCPSCNMAWTRAGRPDRAEFERERRGRKAS